MPRLSQQLPKYRKHKGSGQAFVELSGHRHYLGPHGTKASKIEYDRLIAEWLTSGRLSLQGAGGISIAELLAAYLRHAKGYYGQGPKSDYFHYRRVAKPLQKFYGRTSAGEFGPRQFKVVREQFIADGCSRPFVNICMRRVARIFRWGAGEGLIPASIPQALSMVDGLRRGKTEAKETAPIQPVDDATVEATLHNLSDAVTDMVRFQRLTGCRPAEVCMMRPCDLDRTGDVWTYKPESHKTKHHGRERTIFIGPQAQAVLLRYLARDAQACCFRPCDSEEKRLAEQEANRKTPQSCGNIRGSNRVRKPRRSPGEQYTTDSYRRAVHRACDRAFPAPDGTEGDDLRKWQSEHRWSPNQLRHAAATEVRREFGLEAAQVILGHSQANVTQVYAERDLAKGIEVAARIG